jgi:hypothetical protein
MIARTLLLVVLLAALSPSAHAQRPRERVRPPRALLERMMADLEHDDQITMSGIDSLAKWIYVERRDFNGDGVREWVVVGARYCGSNCALWIYRRLPGGRFVQVHAGGGTGIGTLPARSHGWLHVTESMHMSCCDGPSSTYVFDGRRYQWRDTRYEVRPLEGGEPRTAYHLFVTPSEDPGPQRLVLDPFDAGGGLWISARYDVCRPGRVRTDVCGAPRLILSSARLPAGRVCVRMRVESGGLPPHATYHSRPGGGWCGATTPDAGARGRRRLVLRPARDDWARIHRYYDVDLTGPGLPGRLQVRYGHGLKHFASQLELRYRLPCVDGYGCADEMGRRPGRS